MTKARTKANSDAIYHTLDAVDSQCVGGFFKREFLLGRTILISLQLVLDIWLT